MFVHYSSSNQTSYIQTINPLQVVNKSVATLDEQSPDHADTRKEDNAANIGHCLAGVVDVDKVVGDTTGKVAKAESIQSPVVELGDVASDDSSGEETNVLETVLLGALCANDPFLGGYRICILAAGRRFVRCTGHSPLSMD